MTTDVNAKRELVKKFFMQFIIGAIFGALAVYGLVSFSFLTKMAIDEFVLAAVGMIYLIIGIFVLLGCLSPKFGAKLLNVADEEELHDQRRVLLGSSLAFLGIGSGQLILTLSGTSNIFQPWIGVAAISASMVLCVLIWFRDRHLYDELMWKITMDASYICFAGLWVILFLWCAMALVGIWISPTPATILALFSGGYLLATFIAAGRRGLLAPK